MSALKTILVEDFARPKHRDLSVSFTWPLRKQTASGFADSRSILPAYRSLRVKTPYDANFPNSYFVFKLHSSESLPSGSIRVYGWRDPQPYSNLKSTIQYSRVDGYDWIDMEPARLGSYGAESVFGLSVGHTWRWLQLACFWPALSAGVFLSPTPLTNIVTPDNAFLEPDLADAFIADDFQDGT